MILEIVDSKHVISFSMLKIWKGINFMNIKIELEDEEKMYILSILDIKKMIPVLTGFYERIEFDKLKNIRYKNLFEKK